MLNNMKQYAILKYGMHCDSTAIGDGRGWAQVEVIIIDSYLLK